MTIASKPGQLPIPAGHNPNRVGDLFFVDYEKVASEAQAWAKSHNIAPAANDVPSVCLMVIDMQNTFMPMHNMPPMTNLPVTGALEDVQRTCEFIYKNLGQITQICPTMDTHTSMQIFHSIFLIDDDGNHPTPGTQISEADIKGGKWKVNPAVTKSIAGDGSKYAALQNHLEHYSTELGSGHNRTEGVPGYDLTVWPYHAILGGVDHCLNSLLHETIWFHTHARSAERGSEIKGGNPLTENYSVLRPEVLTTAGGSQFTQKNTKFMQTLLDHDIVIIAGEAKSHCVAWTIDDLLNEINAKDPNLAKKVYLLEDCTSPVVIPGILDFTQQADEAFEKFAAAGMNVVKSTDPIEDWPGVN